MDLLVTTAGVLPPEPVADFVEVLAGSRGRVTVMNVIQTPNEFLQELSADDWRPFESPTGEGPSSHRERREAERYIRERGSKMVAPVVAALRRRNIRPDTVFVEAEDVAQAIIDTAETINADAIVLGATRRLFTESAWTSISMKVSTACNLPVLLIPEPAKATTSGGEKTQRSDGGDARGESSSRIHRAGSDPPMAPSGDAQV